MKEIINYFLSSIFVHEAISKLINGQEMLADSNMVKKHITLQSFSMNSFQIKIFKSQKK